MNHEAWVIPYADLLTLLLAMFLALWATGRADTEKLRALSNAFSDLGAPSGRVVDPGIQTATPDQNVLSVGGLGLLDGGWTSSITEIVRELRTGRAEEALAEAEAAAEARDEETAVLNAAADTLATQVTQLGLGTKVDFTLTERGLEVVLPIDQVLFESGSADLVPSGTDLLTTFAPILRDLDHPIEVIGHTDSQPIGPGGRYASNLELSAARASRVGDYLIQQLGLAADEVSVAGVGDTRPVAANSTPEGRSANRRVEITILFTSSAAGVGPSTEGSTDDG